MFISYCILILLFVAPHSGIDYMLQARLAEGRAQEAEQKLEGITTSFFVTFECLVS